MGVVISGDTGKGTDMPAGDTTAIQLDDGNFVLLAFKDPQLVAAPYGGGDVLGKGLIRFLDQNTGATTRPDIILGTGKTIVNGIEKTPDNGFIVYGQAKESLYGKQFGGATDAFVIKYKSDGTFQWIQSFNTSLHESISGLDIDSNENIYIAGRASYDLSEPRVFGNQSWYGQELGNRYYAAFGASLNESGEIITINAYHPHYNTGGLDIAATSSGYITAAYMAGPPAPTTPVSYSFIGADNEVEWTIEVAINGYSASVESFDSSGEIAIITNPDQVSLIDVSGNILKTISAPNGGTVHDIEVKGDDLFLLSRSGASSNLEVSVYDKNGLQQGISTSIPGSAGFIDKDYFEYDLEILSDGKYLVSGNTGDAGFTGALVGDYREYILFDPNPKPIIRGNSLYTIVDGPSWTEAEANAVKLGGHLVTLNSAEENKWVASEFNQYQAPYIGLTDEGQEGDWEWISGERLVWENWALGAPNGGQSENYSMMYPTDGMGVWDDFRNTDPWGEPGIAEIPFIRRGDSAYVIVEGPTWEEAEANANALGGHLVTINDAEENEFITTEYLGKYGINFFIGASDQSEEEIWEWSSGEEFDYNNWYLGEPSNSDGGEDFSVISGIPDSTRYGYWNDTKGVDPELGIAEIKLAPNNSPTGTPTISGDLKVGYTLTIDASGIQDADNFTGYTPTYQYSWESSTDGITWTALTTTDATDNNATYTLTTAEVGKQIRGVVSYVDGYGTNEVVNSSASVKIEAEFNQPIIRGNSLYTIVDGPSWTQAEANAVKLGGHLSAIGTKTENNFLKTGFSDVLSENLWIGLSDHAQEGNFIWSNGEYVSYQNWNAPEPNNLNNQDYVQLYTNGEWDDYELRNNGINEVNKGIAEIPFIRRGDSAYVIVEGPTWEEAEANANALGGHLVTINDAEENEWLQDQFNTYISETSGGADFWIGYTDREQEGLWQWIDQSDSGYANWGGTGPNNRIGSYPTYDPVYTSTQYWLGNQAPSNPAGEDYALINAVHGLWNDVAPNHRDASVGIAEIKLAPNNSPTGTPTISGDLKVGSTLTIDSSTIQDADNHEYWTPTYQYSWEIANDPGLTQMMPVWETLTTTDATDGNETLEITENLTGKLIRGVVSYLDGYGTNEVVTSDAESIEPILPTQRIISLPTDLTARVGQVIEIPIAINQAQDLQAFDLTFAFDPTLFSVPTSGGLIRGGSLTEGWTVTGNVLDNNTAVKISGFASTPLSSAEGDLAYLRLQVNGDAPRGEALLDLVSASLNEEGIQATLQDGSITITAPKVSIASDLKAPVGGTIEIPISIDDATDLQSIDLVFAYDPEVFTIPSTGAVVTGGDLTSTWSFTANTTIPGEIKISGSGTTPLSSVDGDLINLNLKVNSGIETGTTLLDLVGASFNEGAITADLIDGTLELLPPTFQVTDVRQIASGLALKLSGAPDLDTLNLYDGQDDSVDLPDLRFTHSDGTAVEDLSLHWKEVTSELYVLQTDSLTGINQAKFDAGESPFQSDLLASGDYNLVIDARNDGLISASSGELIDGNGDGITGDAFSYFFTKTAPDNAISIGDTTRGSGQTLGLNGIAESNGISGLPVLISTTGSITQLRGTVTYDAKVFGDVTLIDGRNLPDDWSIETQEDVPGSIVYNASGTTAITGTDQELFRFDAVVSQDAEYASTTLIEATAEAPEDPNLTFTQDPSLVVLAYAGDTTGNGGERALSSLDASRIQRVVVGLDSGFDAYDTIAPTLIGDTTGNGGLSSLDASRIQQEVVGLPVDSFPGLPTSPLVDPIG